MKSDWRGTLYNDNGSLHYTYVSRCPYPFVRYRQVNAAFPEARDKWCTHQSVAYHGKIPCTGGYRCLMCGADMMEAAELQEIKWHLANGMQEMFEEMRNE